MKLFGCVPFDFINLAFNFHDRTRVSIVYLEIDQLNALTLLPEKSDFFIIIFIFYFFIFYLFIYLFYFFIYLFFFFEIIPTLLISYILIGCLEDFIATNQPSCCRAATTTRCWLLYD